MEKLEKAEAEGRKLGINFDTGSKKSSETKPNNNNNNNNRSITLEELKRGEVGDGISDNPQTPAVNNDDGGKINKPATKPDTNPPSPPPPPPATKTAPPKPTSETGVKRKGKKGDN